MKLTPRYSEAAPIVVDLAGTDPGVPLLRQRRRFGSVLAGLAPAQWAAPTRCEGWTVFDVVAHLVDVNRFWALSLTMGAAGSPTTFLAGFDPAATPEQLVSARRSSSIEELAGEYDASVSELEAVVAGIDAAAWSEQLGEAPPGHLPLGAVALHALWDAWVHERDVLLPLGFDPVVEADEVLGSLKYAAALGPGFAAVQGRADAGRLGVVTTDPSSSFVVEVGDTVVVEEGPVTEGTPAVRGDAVALLEGFSMRAPLAHGLPEDDRWLLRGLDVVFDQAPPTW